MPEEDTENTNQENDKKPADETFADFDAFLAKQAEPIRKLYESHTQGLKSALETERTSRREAETRLRELAKTAESEAKKQLTEMADKLAGTERMNQFFAAAHAAGVRNLRLAYLAAAEAKLINERGEVDFTKLKEGFPELFAAEAEKKPDEEKKEDPSKTNPGKGPTLTREAIEKMSPEEINRNWEAVSAALSQMKN